MTMDGLLFHPKQTTIIAMSNVWSTRLASQIIWKMKAIYDHFFFEKPFTIYIVVWDPMYTKYLYICLRSIMYKIKAGIHQKKKKNVNAGIMQRRLWTPTTSDYTLLTPIAFLCLFLPMPQCIYYIAQKLLGLHSWFTEASIYPMLRELYHSQFISQN